MSAAINLTEYHDTVYCAHRLADGLDSTQVQVRAVSCGCLDKQKSVMTTDMPLVVDVLDSF